MSTDGPIGNVHTHQVGLALLHPTQDFSLEVLFRFADGRCARLLLGLRHCFPRVGEKNRQSGGEFSKH